MQNSLIEENIIITEPSKNLRALGRNALAGKWKAAIITSIVFMLCVSLPTYVFDSLFGSKLGNFVASDGYTYGIDPELYAQFYNSMPQSSILSTIYMLLVMGPLVLGISMYFLAMFRRHKVETVDAFLGFEHFGKSLGLFLFMYLFVFLWTLLFIIPGIIAAIRYSQAFFILADDPSKGIRQCMNESKAMMKGNKAKFFWLSLSFIGWSLLASLPSGIMTSIGNIVSSNAFIVGLFGLAGSLCVAPVLAYIMSTTAGFYEILAGHLIKETKPAPIAVEAEALAEPEKAEDAAEEAAADVAESVEEVKDAVDETAEATAETAEEVTDAAGEAVETTETATEAAETAVEEAPDVAAEIREVIEEIAEEEGKGNGEL